MTQVTIIRILSYTGDLETIIKDLEGRDVKGELKAIGYKIVETLTKPVAAGTQVLMGSKKEVQQEIEKRCPKCGLPGNQGCFLFSCPMRK
jgi:hypothetical protein